MGFADFASGWGDDTTEKEPVPKKLKQKVKVKTSDEAKKRKVALPEAGAAASAGGDVVKKVRECEDLTLFSLTPPT